MAVNLWIDVEDLFEYARAKLRPSGIQRLAFEICQALQAGPDDGFRVHFVRHAPARNSFATVPWPTVAALFAAMTAPGPAPAEAARLQGPGLEPAPARQAVRKLVHRLPPSLRAHVIDLLQLQQQALAAGGRLLHALALGVRRTPERIRRRRGIAALVADAGPSSAGFDSVAGPGDVVLMLGAAWAHPDYAALIQEQRSRRGLRFALLIYDLIPLRRPEWCERGLVRVFRAWFESVFPLCDDLFAISRATAADVERYAAERGIPLRRPVVPLPVGAGFGTQAPVLGAPAGHLPAPGSYVLLVSTIEVRKNHLLMFRVWRQMLEEMPRGRVPTLVFAGRVGWLVNDLMQQIANTNSLDGKLVVIQSPADDELAALYQGCLFTVFPSFFEGWGLPVTESLAFGKPCVISDRTSLPEAGGALARSFDPDNLHDAYATIRGVIEDREGLARWQDQVRREYRPVSWSATAAALLAGLRQPRPG